MDRTITDREVALATTMHEMWQDFTDDIQENAMRLAIYRDEIRAEALKEAEEKLERYFENTFVYGEVDMDNIRSILADNQE